MTPPAGADDTDHAGGATVGVIGGSGFYEFLEDAVKVRVPTPYGEPASPLALIAATGLVHQLTVLTRNLADFRKVPGLRVRSP